MESQLIEAWQMSNEANFYLLENIAEDYLQDSYTPRTRSVAAQFAHIHNVRLRWLNHAAPKLVGGIQSFLKGAQPTKEELKQALQASQPIVARFLEECESSGKVKSWNGSPATFLSYMVAHEAHHRALAIVALRICGHKLPSEVIYGQWDWGKKRSLR